MSHQCRFDTSIPGFRSFGNSLLPLAVLPIVWCIHRVAQIGTSCVRSTGNPKQNVSHQNHSDTSHSGFRSFGHSWLRKLCYPTLSVFISPTGRSPHPRAYDWHTNEHYQTASLQGIGLIRVLPDCCAYNSASRWPCLG